MHEAAHAVAARLRGLVPEYPISLDELRLKANPPDEPVDDATMACAEVVVALAGPAMDANTKYADGKHQVLDRREAERCANEWARILGADSTAPLLDQARYEADDIVLTMRPAIERIAKVLLRNPIESDHQLDSLIAAGCE